MMIKTTDKGIDMLLSKVDCFNSRLKNQGESRADRVTSWRDRGNNNIQETRLDNNGKP